MYHKSWTPREGAPDNIEQIATSADGLLWIATDNRLFFFDGVSFERFVPPKDGPSLLSDSLYAVNATPDGSLWVSYLFGGLTRIVAGRITNYTERSGLETGQIHSVVEEPNGSFLISGNVGLQQLAGAQLTTVEREPGIPFKGDTMATPDGEGNLWVSVHGALLVRPRGIQQFRTVSTWSGGTPFCSRAKTKGVWCWADDVALEHFEFSEGKILTTVLPKLHVSGLAASSDGSLWITSRTDGLLHIPAGDLSSTNRNGQPHSFTNRQSLSGNYAFEVLEDREGSVWVATTNGLDQFRPIPLHAVHLTQTAPVVLPQGDAGHRAFVGTDCLITLDSNPPACVPAAYSPEWTRSLYRADDGTIWVGTPIHLWRYSHSKFTQQDLPANLSQTGTSILAIVEDARHRIWISLGGGNGVFRLDDHGWFKAGGLSGLPTATAFAAVRDHSGDIWFGYSDGSVARISADRVRIYRKSDGLDVGPVKVFAVEGDNVWVGGDTGVACLRAGAAAELALQAGTDLRGVTGLAFAPDGALWISQSSGVVRVETSELGRWYVHMQPQVRYRLFDSHDGLQGIPHPVVGLGSAWLAPDGKLYIATRTNLQWIDPLHLPHNDVPPHVFITDWKADDLGGVWPSQSMTLHPHVGELEIGYVASSLLIPDRVQFRYRLDGYDEKWIDAGTRRDAFYSQLSPGTYTFHVSASNDSGIWNEDGAAISFIVPPTFTQTVWFRLAILMAALVLLWQAYSLRLNQIRGRIYDRMSARMAERERIARDLHDTFFQAIQGLLLRFNTATSQLRPDDPARAIFESSLKQSDQVMLEGRELLLDLRAAASEVGDLPALLANFGKQMVLDYPCDFAVVIHGDIQPLNRTTYEELSSMGKEILSNAFRHSKAARIEAELNYEAKELRLRFRDNGVGIESSILKCGHREGHWGLLSVKERSRMLAAQLEIWSRAGAGTEIEVRVPAKVAYAQKDTHGLVGRLRQMWLRLGTSDSD